TAPAVVEIARAQVLEPGERVALVGYGAGAQIALGAADRVAAGLGVRPPGVNARVVKPLDTDRARHLARTHQLPATTEAHPAMGGFGSAVLEALDDDPLPVLRLGIPDRFVEHGKRELLLQDVGLSSEAVADRVVAFAGRLTRVS